MAIFHRNGISIRYETYGDGYPVLAFAPGGMRSAISFWQTSEWDPLETLSREFQVIAMDQRNAGKSAAPISPNDGWHTYTSDHIALLDHLKIEKTHLIGGCIGGPYCLGMIQAIPGRISSAVLQQPIGSENNRHLFYEMFDSWTDAIKNGHPEASEEDWISYRSNMFDHDFLYNTDREFVSSCTTPLLVLMGSDPYHPESISREIARLAPNAALIEEWKAPAANHTVEQVLQFLRENTPLS